MRNLPPKRLSPVGAAVLTPIAVVELNAMEREVALRLPRKQAARESAQRLKEQMEEHLRVAVEAYLGQPATPELLEGRFEVWPDGEDVPTGERGVTYTIDGCKVLWVGPVLVQDNGDEFSARQPVRHHVPGVVPPTFGPT